MTWNMTVLSAGKANAVTMARDGSIVMLSAPSSVMGTHWAQAAMQSVQMNAALILGAMVMASIFVALIARISLLAISLLGLIFVSMITIISQMILVAHHIRTPRPWMTA